MAGGGVDAGEVAPILELLRGLDLAGLRAEFEGGGDQPGDRAAMALIERLAGRLEEADASRPSIQARANRDAEMAVELEGLLEQLKSARQGQESVSAPDGLGYQRARQAEADRIAAEERARQQQIEAEAARQAAEARAAALEAELEQERVQRANAQGDFQSRADQLDANIDQIVAAAVAQGQARLAEQIRAAAASAETEGTTAAEAEILNDLLAQVNTSTNRVLTELIGTSQRTVNSMEALTRGITDLNRRVTEVEQQMAAGLYQ